MSAFWVQIVNMDEEKAVRFPFDDEATAAAFQVALIRTFGEHKTSAVVGYYRDSETCPRAAA